MQAGSTSSSNEGKTSSSREVAGEDSMQLLQPALQQGKLLSPEPQQGINKTSDAGSNCVHKLRNHRGLTVPILLRMGFNTTIMDRFRDQYHRAWVSIRATMDRISDRSFSATGASAPPTIMVTQYTWISLTH